MNKKWYEFQPQTQEQIRADAAHDKAVVSLFSHALLFIACAGITLWSLFALIAGAEVGYLFYGCLLFVGILLLRERRQSR